MVNGFELCPHLFIEVVIAPMDIHIPQALALTKKEVKIGAQNISKYRTGAYTGESSAIHYSDMGLKWAIVGHSERRSKFFEDNETVRIKIMRANVHGIN